MKKINLIFLSLFLLVGLLGFVGLSYAVDECCLPVNSSDPCENPDRTTGQCTNGVKSFMSCIEAKNSRLCSSAPTSGTTGTSVTKTFENPLKVKNVSELLTSLLEGLRGIIVVIAVVFMVIGGIMYMVSGGNENMVKRAKQTWTGAVVGLAIALAAPAFLNEILNILQAKDIAGTGSAITIKQIAVNVLNFLLSIFGVIAIISLIIGGGMYLTAYGDEKRLDSGKKIVTYAIIGIVIALSALAVIRQVANLISVTP